MKAKSIFFALLISVSSLAYGLESCVATIPNDYEIQSSKFDAHNDSLYYTLEARYYTLEVDCALKDGSYVKYIGLVIAKAGWFKAARSTMPKKITFERWELDSVNLVCQ